MKIYAIESNNLNRIIPDDAENILLSFSREFQGDFGLDTIPELYERVKEFKNNYIDPFDRKLYIEAHGTFSLKIYYLNVVKAIECYADYLRVYEDSYDYGIIFGTNKFSDQKDENFLPLNKDKLVARRYYTKNDIAYIYSDGKGCDVKEITL